MMMATDLIKTNWFYVFSCDKVKLNWFIYEYACDLYDAIMRSTKLEKWKERKTDIQIAEFSAYFAKRMKQSVLDVHADIEDHIVFNEDYIADLYHTQSHRQNMALLAVTKEAWHNLIASCKVCPSQCFNDYRSPSEFFDRMESGNFY